MLKVSEVFGPTIQGEGMAAGKHCLFVRLSGCNLECTWCDTPYTWAFTPEKAAKHWTGKQYDEASEMRQMTSLQVIRELERLWPITTQPTTIVISGGEPLMQHRELATLCHDLRHECGCDVHIETAGTILPPTQLHVNVAQYNVSPKLLHSGNIEKKACKPDVLRFFGSLHNAYFKFVIRGEEDLEEIDEIVELCHLDPRRVQVMPEGTSSQEITIKARNLVEAALDRGYGLSFRTHLLLWDDQRGH